MKMYQLLGLLLVVCVSCSTAQFNNTKPTPPIIKPVSTFVQWDKKTQDIGMVKRGEQKTLFFEMTNTSGADIQIDIVDACECTRVDFPRGVIKPGEKTRLNVRFDSTDKETGETIGINIVFKNLGSDGNPRIEVVDYKFDIAK